MRAGVQSTYIVIYALLCRTAAPGLCEQQQQQHKNSIGKHRTVSQSKTRRKKTPQSLV